MSMSVGDIQILYYIAYTQSQDPKQLEQKSAEMVEDALTGEV
jgi:hypothetical protein